MNSSNRTKLSFVVLTVSVTAGLIWSLVFLFDASDDAERAVTDAETTGKLTSEIELLRPIGMKEAADEQFASQIPRLIDDAMKHAEIDAERLDRISPQAARRSEQANMSETPVQLAFREITLHQLLEFSAVLIRGHSWLRMRDLHLSHPPGLSADGSVAAWNVELTISYLTDASPAAAFRRLWRTDYHANPVPVDFDRLAFDCPWLRARSGSIDIEAG